MNTRSATTVGAGIFEEYTRQGWGTPFQALRMQILGAGSAVGRELACTLLASGHPLSHLSLLARQPRALAWHGERLDACSFEVDPPPADVVFLCSPHPLALGLVERQLERGAGVIDLCGAFRERTDVPLVAPGANMSEAGVFTQLVSLPTRSAVLAAQPLWALERAVGLEEVSCVLLCSAAGEGARSILELRGEKASAASGQAGRAREPRVGNVIPVVGVPDAHGVSEIERALAWDLSRLLSRPELFLDTSAIQVDVERCDAMAFNVRLRHPCSSAEAAQIFNAAPYVELAKGHGPTPHDCVGSSRVHVGRIRTGSRGPGSLCFFAVGDQLRFGGALAAMQVAARFAIG